MLFWMFGNEFFEILLWLYKLHMLRTFCKKSILKLLLKSLVKNRLEIVFSKIRRFFRRFTRSAANNCYGKNATNCCTLYGWYSKQFSVVIMGKKCFIYSGFNMRYTDFQSISKEMNTKSLFFYEYIALQNYFSDFFVLITKTTYNNLSKKNVDICYLKYYII